MQRFFTTTYHGIKKHKAISFIAFAILLTAFIFTARKLTLNEDFTKVFPVSKETKQLNSIIKNSAFLERLVFNVYYTSPKQEKKAGRLIKVTETFIDSVKKSKLYPEYIKEIAGKISTGKYTEKAYGFFLNNLPLHLNDNDYNNIDSLLDNPQNMDRIFRNAFQALQMPGSQAFNRFIFSDPFGLAGSKLKKLKKLQVDQNLTLYNDYLFTPEKNNLIFFILPESTNNTSSNKLLFDKVDNLINNIEKSTNHEITIDYFGAAAVATANADQIKKDIQLTVTIALLLLVLLFSYYYRQKRFFLLIVIPVAFGWSFALSIVYFIQGGISAISLGIGSVLLGISVDYALHIMTHNKHGNSIPDTIKNVSSPILMSAITTASAFFCLLLISSEALSDLGLFAGLSVISAAIFSLLLIPQFLKKKNKKSANDNFSFIDKLAAYNFHRKKGFVLSIIILTIVFLFFTNKINFETDLQKNNYMPEKLKSARDKMNNISNVSKKAVFVVSSGSTLNKALTHNDKASKILDSLTNRGIINNYFGIDGLILPIEKQKIKIDKWDDFWTKERIQKLQSGVRSSASKYYFKPSAFDKFLTLPEKSFQPIPPEKQIKPLEKLLGDFIIRTNSNIQIANLITINNQKQKDALFKTFHEKKNIIAMDKTSIAQRFFSILKKDFQTLIRISLIIVFIILVLAFGRIELGLVTFFPILISWIWTTGLMGVFGLKFNIFNIIISTFIFGLGIDYAIFISKGILQQYKYGINNFIPYKSSIILSSFTTIIGMGVLIFAKHPALQSIAALSVIGILSVIIVSFTLQPIAVFWLFYKKNKKRLMPVRLINFVHSLLIYTFFLIFSIFLLSIIPIFLILPVSRNIKKYIFSSLINFFSKNLLLLSFFNRLKIYDYDIEKLKGPSVIISNHQSLTDIFFFMSLKRKLIIITKDWVWNNPIFALVIRYADYINISKGYEKALPEIRKKADEGFSILVFPEGTRTQDGSIKRFHKGAFYIAEKLNLKLLPVIIHGAFDCFPKNEMIFKCYTTSLHFLPSIDLTKNDFGNNYSEKGKKINQYIRDKFQEISRRRGDASYYNFHIKQSFLYKGPVLEWYIKIKLMLEKNYKAFDKIIPREAKITDLGCGYGTLDYILYLTSPKRIITGIDYDDNKIKIADNISFNNKNINFITKDITKDNIEKSDIFILYDVLHYLSNEQQNNIMDKCIKNLNPGGIILIRDSDKKRNSKHLLIHIFEIFSTTLGHNKAREKLTFFSSESIKIIAEQYGLSYETIADASRTSNTLFILKKKK